MGIKLTKAMRADLGLPAEDAPGEVESRLDRLVAVVEATAQSAEAAIGDIRIQAVRQEQMIAALKTISMNTERRPWTFPVVRDREGRITSIRAIPEEAGT